MFHPKSFVAATVALIAAAGSAQATFISFASDDDSSNWTFRSTPVSGSSFGITSPTLNALLLKLDDNNGSAPTLALPARFAADLSVTWGSSNPIFPGSLSFNHTYLVNGAFTFSNPVNLAETWLTIRVGSATGPNGTPGVLVVPGGRDSWSSAGGIIGADQFASVEYVATQAFINAINQALVGTGRTAETYGIAVGSSAGPDDFGFSLSVINVGGPTGTAPGPNVQLDGNKLPIGTWRSESSFSGSAVNGIPSPGGLALMALAGLIGFRRRRA